MKRILFLVALCSTNFIYSQQGSIDNNFGQDGFVSGDFPSQINSISSFDNKLLATGGGFNASGKLAACFLDNGILDSTFGNNGYASLNKQTGGGLQSVILPDKKILVCGGFVDEHFNLKSFVAKYTSNGKIDSSFGDNGMTIVPLFHKADGYSEIALNSDGSIIVGGSGTNSVIALDSQYSVISRLSSNGLFDKTFGNNGYVINLSSDVTNDLAIQEDGKIVTAGQNLGNDFVFSRYNSDGSLDKSFGIDGTKILKIGADNSPKKIVIQQNGKLMIGGYLAIDKYKMCALRLNPNGSLDETFGDNGKTLIDFENNTSQAYDMLQQPDGKLVLVGNAYDSKQNRGYFGLCRITNDGKLDSSFGINGLQTTAYGINNGAYCAALQSDGKIVTGGFYKILNAEASYLIVRYNNEYNQKQIIITKIKKWLQHHNGFIWDYNSNISSYVVQRSYDGIHFSSIAKINASNSSNTYADLLPLTGNNYYRLQTTSRNGAINYSNVIAITTDEDAIKIAPNPAKDCLKIEGLSSSNKAKLTVVDFSGNVKLQAVANKTAFNLNIASLKVGNYLLKIEMNDKMITKKFVKE